MNHRSTELNESQNHCETKASSSSTFCWISHVILPDMVCFNDSHFLGEVFYTSEENHDQKSGTVLTNVNFSSH